MSTKKKTFSWGGIPVPNTLEHTGALKTNTAFSIWSRATHPSWTQPPQRWCCEFLRFALANGSSHDHDAGVWVPSRMGVPHADVAIICFKRPQVEDDLRHCGSVKRKCDSTCSVSKTSCLEMALKHVNTRKWTSPVFVGWLVANLKGHQSAQAPRICFKFLSELSNVENSSAVTSSLTLNMTMWWAPASGETDKDGEFTTKTWENDQELPSNPLVFSEVKIATSCTSSGRSSPIWVAIGVWSIPGMHWTIQWKVVPWSGGKIHPSNLQSWARDQHTSRWAIFEDMELPLLSTFKVTSLSPAKTKKDLVNLQKRSKKHNITENITSLRNENKWNKISNQIIHQDTAESHGYQAPWGFRKRSSFSSAVRHAQRPWKTQMLRASCVHVIFLVSIRSGTSVDMSCIQSPIWYIYMYDY